ncbi:MAG TPA: phosphatase PAP2 family protein [Phycisphaerae bacterium]|nr:phosphatase PAP2 family protein [Phycisphaerae bacterium]
MPTAKQVGWLMALAIVPALMGCGGEAALRRQAQATCRHVAAAAPAAAPSADRPRSVVYFAPREAPAPVPTGDAGPGAEAKREPPDAPPATIEGMSFGEILKIDLRETPRQMWSGTKHSFANPGNLLVLGVAFGADRIVRHNLDGRVRDELRHDDTSLAETGDFGSVIGNPALHFGIAGAWYLGAVHGRNAEHHAMSKVMIEALAVNGLATGLLKVSMGDQSPNGERYGWPSGHTSSSVCFAAVMHEYYGWKAGLPLYLLAGYSAATRLEDREHDLSDLVFGAALGWVVGHSVAKGELPQIAGFHVLPYKREDAGGLMLVKQW